MKLLLMAFTCLALNVNGQSKVVTHTVKGVVADSTSKERLDFITVSLKTDKNVTLRSSLTKTEGTFSFSGVAPGNYSLAIIAVGYQPKIIVVEVGADKNLGTIYITRQSTQLNTVVVTGDKPLITQEVDRIAYNVQADPESKTDNVLDMLRKVPMVSIDGDDNIQVKGSGNFKVLINGRPSSLVARDPKEVFKSMPASNIQKIEVITTPPAKYDSEGLAGIINIITNKKIDNGYNGSVGSRHDFIDGPGVNTSFTVKTRKFGFSANGSINTHQPPARSFNQVRNGFLPFISQLNQSGQQRWTGTWGYVNTELSYEIDTLNLLTASVGYNNAGGDYTSSSIMSQYDQNSVLNQFYRLNNDGQFNWGGNEIGVNYQLSFKRHKEQLLTASYKFNFNNEGQTTLVSVLEKMNYDFEDYRQQNNSGTKEHTIQLDYAHPLKKVNIEGGVKAILRNNFSDYGVERFDPSSGTFVVNDSRTNRFNYKQGVFSFYNS